MSDRTKRSIVAAIAAALQGLVGVTAIAGGLKLLSAPNGSAEFPVEWLDASPFASYWVPALILVIVLGVGGLLASAVIAISRVHRGLASLVGGIVLLGFLLAEVWWIGLRTPLQPMYMVVAVILIVCGMALRRWPMESNARHAVSGIA